MVFEYVKWCQFFPSALSLHQLAAQGEVTEVAAHLSKGEEVRPSYVESGAECLPCLTVVLLYFGRQFTAQQRGRTGLYASDVGSGIRGENHGGLSPGPG